MNSRIIRRIVAASLAGGCALSASAGGHRDWTVIPLGSFSLENGAREMHVTRPYDRFGVIKTPIVFVALFDPTRQRRGPIEIEFRAGERVYPRWTVTQAGQMYVIGSATLERDAVENGRALRLNVSVRNARDVVVLMAGSGPDLALAGDSVLGPLTEIERRLERGTFREYVHAINASLSPQLAIAKATFERLGRGRDQRIARFARDKLRRIRFAELEARLEGSVKAHYRMGLYAQQCGLFRSARRHFEQALQIDPRNTETWFRLGEMMERCGDPIEDVANVMRRAGEAAGTKPNTWDVLVPILLAKEYEREENGRQVKELVEMTPEQIAKIHREWRLVEKMIYGASHGRLKLKTRFMEIATESVVPYGLNAGWLYGPSDELVPMRGRVDCVMSFHPRGPSVTGGADCGPNGAAMTDIGPWAGWEVMLHEWNHQFDWTVRTSEAGDGFPITHHSDGCGHGPIPSMGYGHRAAMHYYVTPAMYDRLEPADPDNGAGYVRSWHISDPLEIVYDEEPPEAGGVSAVRNYGPAETRDWPRRFVAADADFVDLQRIFVDAGVPLRRRMIAAATTHVWSPARREVRIWLGHNDVLALWVNERLIHRGDYGAIAKFEDRNLPNMVATAATLRKGWNRLDAAVEAWPEPRDEGFGFALRICDFENQPITGLRVATEKEARRAVIPPDPFLPRPGRFYKWDEVRDDFYKRLPLLTPRWLSEHVAARGGFALLGKAGTTEGTFGGFVALGSGADRDGDFRGGMVLRAIPSTWNPKTDADARLNNVLDWNRESVCAYPFQAPRNTRAASGDDGVRHLMLMRPEAVEAFLTCLRESPAAAQVYRGKPVRDRILGTVRVGQTRGEAEGVRVLIVAETILPTPLPVDEEDLLSPIGR